MSFIAAYPSYCALEGDPILVGDLIEYVPGSIGSSGFQHVECARRLDLAVAAGICPKCFMARALSGECGCV